jgi:hypothetical protein
MLSQFRLAKQLDPASITDVHEACSHRETLYILYRMLDRIYHTYKTQDGLIQFPIHIKHIASAARAEQNISLLPLLC